MKKSLFIGTGIFILSACSPNGSTQSDPKNDSLMVVIDERNTELNEFITSFNEIESNLDSVAAKQKIILLYSGNLNKEIKGNKKQRINAEIHAINDLMDKNRQPPFLSDSRQQDSWLYSSDPL